MEALADWEFGEMMVDCSNFIEEPQRGVGLLESAIPGQASQPSTGRLWHVSLVDTGADPFLICEPERALKAVHEPARPLFPPANKVARYRS